MLNESTFQSTYPLVRNLDLRRLALKAVPGTLLDELVSSSAALLNSVAMNRNSAGELEVDQTYLAGATNVVNPTTARIDHSDILEVAVERLSAAVNKHLYFARTVAVPAIEELVKRLVPQLETLKKSSLSDLDIEMYRMAEPLVEQSFQDAVEQHRESPVYPLSVGAKLPVASFEQIMEMMKTGAASVDAALVEYFSKIGEVKTVRMYNDLFTQQGRTGVLSDFLSSDDGEAYAILAFAIARKLWDNPPEDVNMSMKAYQTYMVDLRNMAGRFLCLHMDRLARDDNSGLLVRSFTKGVLQVNETVYRNWLKNGGSNEVLFGSMLDRNPAYTVRGIDEKSQEYGKAWERYRAMNQVTEANNKFAAAKRIARLEFGEILAGMTQEECPLQDRAAVLKDFEAALDVTRMDEIDDIYNWAMRLICDSRFKKTAAKQILSGLARVYKYSPSVSAREAGAIAAIEYIALWVAGQFQLTDAAR